MLNNEGGAIYSLGKLTVVNSRFYANVAHIGGAISSHDVMLTVENSEFAFNRSESVGGGLFGGGAMTATIHQGVFHNNEAETGGGGAYLYDNSGEQTASVMESQFLTNTAAAGGGLFIFGLTSYLTDTLLVSNTTSSYGGGMSITGGKATVTRTDVYSNTAGQYGAGVHAENADVTYRDSIVRGNITPQTGGGLMLNRSTGSVANVQFVNNEAMDAAGVYLSETTVSIADSVICQNRASRHGGGLYLEVSDAHFTDTLLIENSAILGGGLYSTEESDSFLRFDSYATLFNSEVQGNSATQDGGGIYNDGGELTLTDSTIRANRAVTSGGGIYNEDVMTLTGMSLLENVANGFGGAVEHTTGTMTIDQSCIVNNGDTAVEGIGAGVTDADGNWWGAPNGPSGAGPGEGDSVGPTVDFEPFLSSPILSCPLRNAAVAITKRASPAGDLLPGQPLTYTITMTNNGPTSVKNLYVTDVLPAGFVLLSTETTAPFNGTSYLFEQLGAAEVATVVLIGKVDGTINDETLLSNTATVTNTLISALSASTTNPVVLPVAQWSASSYSVTEDASSFTATVTLTPPNPYVTVTVQAVITDSAATFAAAALQNITFTPGNSSQPVAVPIVDDAVVAARTVDLGLQLPDGATLGPNAHAVITLIEDDAAVESEIFLPKLRR